MWQALQEGTVAPESLAALADLEGQVLKSGLEPRLLYRVRARLPDQQLRLQASSRRPVASGRATPRLDAESTPTSNRGLVR